MKQLRYSAAALAAAGMLCLFGGPAAAQESRADARFARDAAVGGMTEVELGRLAVQKSSDDKIKQFGQRMIDDHSKADDRLKSIAAKDNITLPSELDARHKAMVDRFSNMSGAEFDRMYARDMVRDHQTDLAAFEKEANNGTNADLKDFAMTTLPTLREHLQMAKDNERSIGITSRR